MSCPGGRVLLRSASTKPWYLKTFKNLGFQEEENVVRQPGSSIDRVNMYANCTV